MKELNKLNNELKSYINEANFISNKCRNKLITILGKEFNIDVKLENYANVDVKILEEKKKELDFTYKIDIKYSSVFEYWKCNLELEHIEKIEF